MILVWSKIHKMFSFDFISINKIVLRNHTHKETRPDTWPILVADGWAGAQGGKVRFHTFQLDQYGPTYRRTDGQSLL